MNQTLPKISSRRHELVKRLRDIRDGRDKSLLFVEGLRLSEELFHSPLKASEFFATAGFLERHPGLDKRFRDAGAPGTVLDDQVMDYVSDVASPPGLIVLAERAAAAPLSKIETPLFVVLDGLQSPNNVGAVVRAAEAAGAQAVFQLAGGADPLGPKALRASAGAAFRLPVFSVGGLADLREKLKPVAFVSADPRGKTLFTEWDWKAGAALVLGAETAPERREDVPTIRIPMAGRAESLNVAVAAGIILHEAYRQRSSVRAEPVKRRAFGSPFARGLKPRANTAEEDPRPQPPLERGAVPLEGAWLGRAEPGAPAAVEARLRTKPVPNVHPSTRSERTKSKVSGRTGNKKGKN